jgi:glycosyltransferase involved in cell wall biosynthesis
MRVLHQTNSLTIGGVETFVYRLCKNSPEETAVITYKDGIIGKWLSNSCIPVYDNGLETAINAFKPDIVVMHSGSTLPEEYPKCREKFPKVKFITVLHTLYPIPDQTVDKIVCISKSVYDCQKDKTKCVIIHPGIEIHNEWFNCPVVGNVTRIAPYKHINDILSCAELVKVVAPDAKFVIVGEEAVDAPGYITVAREIARQRGLGNSVFFTGYVDNVEEYYKYFDVFLHPVGKEAYPVVLYEAMSHKIPVVTTSTASEIIVHTENGFIADTPTEMAYWVLFLLSRRTKYFVNKLKDIKDTCKQFSWLYNELYNSSPK